MARRTKGLATPKAARRRERKRKAGIQVRRKKEFTYRGMTLDKLQELNFKEFMDIIPSRQRRSFRRGLSKEQAKLITDSNNKPDKVLRTHRREMIIIPQFVGRTFAVHNGKEFVNLEIMPEMIGLYFGELAPTRTSPTHTGPGVGATKSSKFMPLK
ncbi:MAG: 30S ribosomal protein S19 [Candidatus Thermoplasmatota archaeon]|jgi:small subunit ribosomal protein S19|nr:30S ribosomal protein S19 [Euryarchaeota archaeon]MEC7686846.1 30S ribosomal protein S19 [Candidatus Thermoplasmatota archaeon]|tara:strand:- start:242 stop:709 length:468 start_codon:yes stop_codon:yes gene_type:complete